MGWSIAALILSLFVICLAIIEADESRVTYEGRTVEDWLSNSHWEMEKTDAEFAIMMLGEKAVEPLRAILRLTSPGWAISTAWRIPFGNRVFKRPLQNAVKKKRAIECLNAVGLSGERLLPEVIAIAEDESEFLRLRQIALRYLHQHMLLTADKSNLLVRLSGDASLGPEAARYFQSFKRQHLSEETRKLAEQINHRLDSTKQSGIGLPSPTNSIFQRDRTLWESKQ